MKLKIGNIISIISVLILLKGLNSYFNVKNKKWTKIDAFVANIDVLSRTVNKDKKYRLITKYNYQVDDVNYNGIYMSNWESEQLINKINPKYISIYYKNANPHISTSDIPIEGMNEIIIGSILLIFGLYILSNRCEQ